MDLASLRAEIDGVDRELLALFQRRMRIVEEVARYKRGRGLPVHHPDRERQILDRAASGSDPELAPYAERFFQRLLELSRERQETL